MLTVQPPNPAPVILEPKVPSTFHASSTRVSSSIPVTSYKSLKDLWDSSISSPKPFRSLVFSFCTAQFTDSYQEFKANALLEIEKIKNNVSIKDEPGRDDLLYVTSIPWVSFTSITHPVQMNPVDSIPRISGANSLKRVEK
jgi:hypothetical protein